MNLPRCAEASTDHSADVPLIVDKRLIVSVSAETSAEAQKLVFTNPVRRYRGYPVSTDHLRCREGARNGIQIFDSRASGEGKDVSEEYSSPRCGICIVSN